MVRNAAYAFHLLLITTVSGLEARYPSSSPWSGCSSWTEDLSFICDPDDTLSDLERMLVREAAGGCQDQAKFDNLHIVLFISASLSFPVPTYVSDEDNNNSTSDENKSQGNEVKKEGREAALVRLQNQVVTSHNISTSSFPTLLILATKNPFQVSVWVNEDVGVSSSETRAAEEAARSSHTHHHHLSTALTHALHYICQKVTRQDDDDDYNVHYFVFTVTWIFLSLIFIIGLVVIALCLVKARRSRGKEERLSQGYPGEEDHTGQPSSSHQQAPGDIGVVYYRSTSNVLLGTTDITAVASNRCSSTDNLIDT